MQGTHTASFTRKSSYPEFFFLPKRSALKKTILPQPNLLRFNQRLTDLEKGNSQRHPPRISNMKEGKYQLRLTKSLKPNRRTIECFSSPHTLPPYQ